MADKYPMRTSNKMSEKGEAKGHGAHPAEKISKMTVGSSDGNGIRFPIHDHPDKSVVRPQGK